MFVLDTPSRVHVVAAAVLQADEAEVVGQVRGAALVYSDPPFGSGKQFMMVGRGHPNDRSIEHPAYDDPLRSDLTSDQLESFVERVLAACADDGFVALHLDSNHAWRYRSALEAAGSPDLVCSEIVVRSGSRDARPRDHVARSLTPTHNSIWIAGRTPPPRKRIPEYDANSCPGGRRGVVTPETLPDTLWCDLDVRGRETGYPTEKSRALAARLVDWLAPPDSLVVETHAGSGTVSLIALETGRRSISVDVSAAAASVTFTRMLPTLLRTRRLGRLTLGEGHRARPLSRTGVLSSALGLTAVFVRSRDGRTAASGDTGVIRTVLQVASNERTVLRSTDHVPEIEIDPLAHRLYLIDAGAGWHTLLL